MPFWRDDGVPTHKCPDSDEHSPYDPVDEKPVGQRYRHRNSNGSKRTRVPAEIQGPPARLGSEPLMWVKRGASIGRRPHRRRILRVKIRPNRTPRHPLNPPTPRDVKVGNGDEVTALLERLAANARRRTPA